MDKKVVYVETSVVSYLANRPSRDLIVAAHQALTREWWEHRSSFFKLCVSEIVLDEAELATRKLLPLGWRTSMGLRLLGLPTRPSTLRIG